MSQLELQGKSKKHATKLLAISLSNVSHFLMFNFVLLTDLVENLQSKVTPQLRCVTTRPCEI